MRTALDVPLDALDAEERNFTAKVREHGWIGLNVFGENGRPDFSYTTGFWLTLQMPEILIFSMNPKSAQDILWDLFRNQKAGAKFGVAIPASGIFGNAEGYLFPMAKARYPEHLGWGRWFYGGDAFPCLQLVWPDAAGKFPWQAGFNEAFRTSQPDLTEQGWINALAH